MLVEIDLSFAQAFYFEVIVENLGSSIEHIRGYCWQRGVNDGTATHVKASSLYVVNFESPHFSTHTNE